MMEKRVLIVDDDKKDRDILRGFVEGIGCEVVEAEDGAIALDLLEEGEIDVVFLDIRMPTFSGYDLLRLMKRRVSDKIKVIYVSIIPQDDVDVKDVDGFLQKPFSLESLLKTLKGVMEDKTL